MEPLDTRTQRPVQASSGRSGEEGYMLLGLIVTIAIILLVLGEAASKAAFSIRRDREVESARRADQYVRAIRKFYLKTQHYPGSIEQLENTNNVRYLRQKYIDPLTGKDDYRLIPVGQNKTTVKGFFGAPLEGIASAGLGSAAGMQSPGMPGSTTAGTGTAGTAGGTGFGSFGGAGAGLAGAGGTSTGGFGGTGGSGTASTSGSGLGSAQGLASGLPGTGSGPFMGVGSSATGPSILIVNEQTTYDTWEFLYDPRLEKLRLAAMLNAGVGSTSAGALGTAPGSTGTTNGFGSSGGFGSSNGSGTTNAPPGGTTPAPQP
jgi:type II secretory pathway pseudopilin PulG